MANKTRLAWLLVALLAMSAVMVSDAQGTAAIEPTKIEETAVLGPPSPSPSPAVDESVLAAQRAEAEKAEQAAKAEEAAKAAEKAKAEEAAKAAEKAKAEEEAKAQQEAQAAAAQKAATDAADKAKAEEQAKAAEEAAAAAEKAKADAAAAEKAKADAAAAEKAKADAAAAEKAKADAAAAEKAKADAAAAEKAKADAAAAEKAVADAAAAEKAVADAAAAEKAKADAAAAEKAKADAAAAEKAKADAAAADEAAKAAEKAREQAAKGVPSPPLPVVSSPSVTTPADLPQPVAQAVNLGKALDKPVLAAGATPQDIAAAQLPSQVDSTASKKVTDDKGGGSGSCTLYGYNGMVLTTMQGHSCDSCRNACFNDRSNGKWLFAGTYSCSSGSPLDKSTNTPYLCTCFGYRYEGNAKDGNKNQSTKWLGEANDSCASQNPQPCNTCADPHITGFDGTDFDFMGYANAVFSLYSDPFHQINMLLDDFEMPDATFMKAIGFMYGPHLQIAFNTVNPGGFDVIINGHRIDANLTGAIKLDSAGHVTYHQVFMPDYQRVVLTTPTLRLVVTKSGKDTKHLNSQITFTSDLPDPSTVHGVLGQTVRWVAEESVEFEGEEDDYVVHPAWDLMGMPLKHAMFEGRLAEGKEGAQQPRHHTRHGSSHNEPVRWEEEFVSDMKGSSGDDHSAITSVQHSRRSHMRQRRRRALEESSNGGKHVVAGRMWGAFSIRR